MRQQTDLGFRYGGEEFMVLLTKTASEQLLQAVFSISGPNYREY